MSSDKDESIVIPPDLARLDNRPATHCHSCGAPLIADYGDELCQTCFVSHGISMVAEILSTQAQQSLFENLMTLSLHAHQREQTDAAYHSISAAYHAAYQPLQLDRIIREAQNRFDSWDVALNECGEVRAEDYRRLAEEARELKRDMMAMMADK